MRVVVPHIGAGSPHAGLVRLVLEADGIPVELVEVDPHNGYVALLIELWRQGETFVLVEHDVIPWPGAIAQLLHCDREWCAFPYRHRGGPALSLGCTKFAGSLTRRLARVALDFERDPMHPWGHGRYEAVDGALFKHLQRWGETAPHEHGPMVAHLNPQQRKEKAFAS